MNFADELLRGIPNKQFVDSDGSPSASLFHFGTKSNILHREDGFHEESINWHDDQGAKNLIFAQKKENGELQFKAGIAVLIRKELDHIRSLPLVKNYQLFYERKAIDGNEYHGNLLLKSNTPTPIMKKIAAMIAMTVDEVIPAPCEIDID